MYINKKKNRANNNKGDKQFYPIKLEWLIVQNNY